MLHTWSSCIGRQIRLPAPNHKLEFIFNFEAALISRIALIVNGSWNLFHWFIKVYLEDREVPTSVFILLLMQNAVSRRSPKTQIPTFIIETLIWNATTFVYSTRTILTLLTSMDKNVFSLQSYSSKTKSYISGNSKKIGVNAKILSVYYRRNSRPSYKQA